MTTRARNRKVRRFRAVIATVLVSLALLGALLAAVGSLNRDLYSAGGFVRLYLETLSRHDSAGALALPGVTPSAAELRAADLPVSLPATLLRSSLLGDLTDIRVQSDRESSPGVHAVRAAFTLNDKPSTMTFLVEDTGTFGLVFDRWRFKASPLAVLQVSVLHEASFTVNGLTLDTRAHAEKDAPLAFSNSASYLAFAPAVFTFSHDSSQLSAAATPVRVTTSGAQPVTIDAEPTQKMIDGIQSELNAFLDDCATQTVLQPTGCPYGIEINNRVTAPPAWSIAEYPPVTLAPGESSFIMAATNGQARINVPVQSLFDGSRETRDEIVDFSVGMSVTIRPNGSLAIQLN